ncbi:MAG: type I restriction enzyme HsdR N-terminal domain-containing protein [Prevotella sp.]|nr:type I restriction enzyme HsdR N-terminal domain-containing protein [Prevotella sp.]
MEMKIWNRLCEKVNKRINVSEGRFEKEIVLEFLGALNWSEYYDNLEEQYQIDVHGDKWIPDFALFADGNEEPDIIVELKKPSHKQRSKDRRQITTYMKLVDCRFGLYFGEKLELFYLDYEPEKRVSKSVLSVEFNKNNKNGKRLIDLLKFDSYDRNRLRSFCEDQIKLDNVCKYWCSNEGVDKLYSFILKQSQLPTSMVDLLRLSLNISVSQKVEIAEEDSSNESNWGCADKTVTEDGNEDYKVFRLKEPKKGTDAHMYYYPKELMYVIKANSKVSTNETKDCSPEASALRKKVFEDNTWSRNDDNVYTLLRDIIIKPKSGQPNVSAHFCTGRSTNGRAAWIDGQGRTFSEVFPKDRKTVVQQQIEETSEEPSTDTDFLGRCASKLLKTVGLPLMKKGRSVYVTPDGKTGYVIRTSKMYTQGNREKYWYAYRKNKELKGCEHQFFVYGCKDENTIIVLPISEIDRQLDYLNNTKDANDNPLYWHIVFLKDNDGKMTWLISKPKVHEVDITDRLLK